jgi:hypothetical protein
MNLPALRPDEKRPRFARVRRADAVIAAALFLFTAAVLHKSPVKQYADSMYSMLLSESLVYRHSFALDSYDIPRREPNYGPGRKYALNGTDFYHIELVGDRMYYWYPIGTPVLSAPFVVLMNKLSGLRAERDNRYDPAGALTLEVRLAALLMAALAVVFYATARQVLPRGLSLLTAAGAVFGTQIWSTASRALWSETWGIFLFGFVILMLVRAEAGGRRLRPVLLATLLAWTFFTRPTFAIPIIFVTAYVLLFHRRAFVWYAATGAAWLAAFVALSWHLYRLPLPTYYLYQSFNWPHFAAGLAGVLVSPSRGLLIYVPVLPFAFYLFARYRKLLPLPRLAWVAAGIVATQVMMLGGYTYWWGGFAYGPRLLTGLVPWFFLLGMLAVKAWTSAPARAPRARLEAVCGAALLALSVFIQGLGALSPAAWGWNQRLQINDNAQMQEAVWDWRHPQIPAGLRGLR